eukprot:1185387-Rhodomonas_salina.1
MQAVLLFMETRADVSGGGASINGGRTSADTRGSHPQEMKRQRLRPSLSSVNSVLDSAGSPPPPNFFELPTKTVPKLPEIREKQTCMPMHTGIVLRSPYAKSGTESEYAPTRPARPLRRVASQCDAPPHGARSIPNQSTR